MKAQDFKLLLISLVVIAASLAVIVISSCYHAGLYDEHRYNCQHMSRDIEDKLESLGIQVIIITGMNITDTSADGHMWISICGVQFDSVTMLPCCNSEVFNYNVQYFNDYAETL